MDADYGGSGWEDSNPSVFIMTIVDGLYGEYQLTNGYGPDRARQVLQVIFIHFNKQIYNKRGTKSLQSV